MADVMDVLTLYYSRMHAVCPKSKQYLCMSWFNEEIVMILIVFGV
jgi:hypothetical protein